MSRWRSCGHAPPSPRRSVHTGDAATWWALLALVVACAATWRVLLAPAVACPAANTSSSSSDRLLPRRGVPPAADAGVPWADSKSSISPLGRRGFASVPPPDGSTGRWLLERCACRSGFRLDVDVAKLRTWLSRAPTRSPCCERERWPGVRRPRAGPDWLDLDRFRLPTSRVSACRMTSPAVSRPLGASDAASEYADELAPGLLAPPGDGRRRLRRDAPRRRRDDDGSRASSLRRFHMRRA